MAIERIYKQTESAKLFDKVIGCLQDGLGELSWLNHIFGRAERLCKVFEGKRIYTPAVYLGRGEYEPLTPDNTGLGNYCFFVMDEPQRIMEAQGLYNRVRSPFSLIVWVDMRTIGQKDDRNTEAVKEAVIKAVRRAWLKNGSCTIERIYERAENVFSGFTLDECDNQYLMSPYWGMRITGELITNEDCEV